MTYLDKEKQYACQRDWYNRNKKRHTANVRLREDETRIWFRELKKTLRCQVCSESAACCLDFHHLDPSQKDYSLSAMPEQGMSKLRILEEMKKCAVLCSNCHRKVHAGLIDLSSLNINSDVIGF